MLCETTCIISVVCQNRTANQHSDNSAPYQLEKLSLVETCMDIQIRIKKKSQLISKFRVYNTRDSTSVHFIMLIAQCLLFREYIMMENFEDPREIQNYMDGEI